MCNYNYKYEKHHLTEEPCIYPAFYTQYANCFKQLNYLPIDPAGLCVFHSHDHEWKSKNDFLKMFNELLVVTEVLRKSDNKPKWPYNFSGFCFSEDEKFDLSFPRGSSIDMTFCNFIAEMRIKNAEINSIDVSKSTFNEKFYIEKTRFISGINATGAILNNGLQLTGCSFEGYNYLDDCKFLNLKSSVDSNFMFRDSSADYFSFEGSLFDTNVTFQKIEFNGEVIFDKAVFVEEFYFHNNKLRDTISFRESSFRLAENRIPMHSSANFKEVKVFPNGKIIFKGISQFENMVRGELLLTFEEGPDGIISFENFNLNKISLQSKLKLFELEKLGKVEIGQGCRKYYCQTDVRTLEVSNSSQKLILDIITVFSNYFEIQQGYNLGIEIMERTKSKISYFYFTDEVISKEAFIDKIDQNEKSLWGAFSNLTKNSTALISKNDIGTKNCLIDLAGLFLKIGNQLEQNTLLENEFSNIFDSVSARCESILDTQNLLQQIELRWNNFNNTVPILMMKDMSTKYINYGNVDQFGENNVKKIISENSTISKEQLDIILKEFENVKKEVEPEKKQNKLTKFIKEFGPTIGEAAVKMISAAAK